MARVRLADVEVVLHHQTERAYLVSTSGDRGEAKWVPKSVAEYEPSAARPDRGTLTLPEELAVDRGFV